MINLRLVLGGIKSYLPLPKANFRGTGGTDDALYCYNIWARHLFLISHFLGRRLEPKSMVEIGPGDSIGVGIAALLSGVDTYTALDVLPHSDIERNMHILSGLVELFRDGAPMADDLHFPRMYPRLATYNSPARLWFAQDLKQRLSPSNVEELAREIRQIDTNNGMRLSYRSPWSVDSIAPGSVDLVFSQVALQDMSRLPSRDDLAININAMVRWLKPGGIMSHQIDFACPGGRPWNHHWIYGDRTWALICGRRPYYVNRVPLSEYVDFFHRNGCDIVGLQRIEATGILRSAAAKRFKELPEDDFRTSGAFVVAVKR